MELEGEGDVYIHGMPQCDHFGMSDMIMMMSFTIVYMQLLYMYIHVPTNFFSHKCAQAHHTTSIRYSMNNIIMICSHTTPKNYYQS